jgi:hemerythrin-like domain-containing protein
VANQQESPAQPDSAVEGRHIYDELIAVHTIMRRGTVLVATALERLASGEQVSLPAAVRVARWQAEFIHHHHASEDELFWPVLRGLFPDAVAALDELSGQHERLDEELKALTAAIDAINSTRPVARDAATAAANVRDILAAHLDAEEPVLRRLFPQTPAGEILRLRKAIVDGAPRSGPDLVLGLLDDPNPAPGRDQIMGNFPAPVRLLRPLFVRKYQATKRALGS